MINHRITHIFRKRTQNEQKNYCCIQRTTQEPSALRICSKKAFVVQIPLFCKRLGGSFTRMNSCHVWRPVGALMKKSIEGKWPRSKLGGKRFLRDYGFPDSIDLQLCRMVQYLLVEQYFLERFPQFPLFSAGSLIFTRMVISCLAGVEDLHRMKRIWKMKTEFQSYQQTEV